MGEVYLAWDLELKRTVALKILPSDVATDQQRMNRFVQEARVTSGLNHPNILTIYDIGRTDSTRFIATEFIEGETLRARLQRSRLTLNEALNICVQVASALAAAHEVGIIHRDIKLRTSGCVVTVSLRCSTSGWLSWRRSMKRQTLTRKRRRAL